MPRKTFKIETYNPFDEEVIQLIKSLKVYIKSVKKIERLSETVYQMELNGSTKDLQLIIYKVREKEQSK